MIKRHETFFELALGWRDADSGCGAGRFTSPELRAFFEGWMGEAMPVSQDLINMRHRNPIKDGCKESAARLNAFANRLEELAHLFRCATDEQS